MNKCPFCGKSKTKVESRNQRLWRDYHPYTVKRYYAYCNVCHARGSLMETEEKAIEVWNNSYAPIKTEVEYAFRYAMNASGAIDHEHFEDEVDAAFEEFKLRSDYFGGADGE